MYAYKLGRLVGDVHEPPLRDVGDFKHDLRLNREIYLPTTSVKAESIF